jgi:methionyl-tRNA synthetase
MALDLPLPRQVLAHAHWTINHEKMSKSTGNVVNPMFAIERFGVDTMRYYLAIDGGLSSDSDYENMYIVNRYKKGLQWGIGNLTSRLLRSKKWDVRNSIIWAAEGRLPAPSHADSKHEALLDTIRHTTKTRMEELDPRTALKSVMDLIYEVRSPEHIYSYSMQIADIGVQRRTNTSNLLNLGLSPISQIRRSPTR